MEERKKGHRIFVARALPQPAVEAMARHAGVLVSPHDRDLTADELAHYAADCTILVSTPANRIDAGLLERCHSLKMVANYSVGVDHIDLEATGKRGVVVSNTPDVLTDATANLALALILAVTRRLVEGDRLMRANGFQGVAPMFMLGSSLEDKVLGIFGFGRVGQALARRCHMLGMRIVYTGRRPNPAAAEALGARFVYFEELLAQSDIVSVNAPLTDQTRLVFDYTAFKRMKPGAYFINTGRGPIHVEADLVTALTEHHLAGAGLDVYEAEPMAHPGLLSMQNVVLAPHLGSATVEVRTRMAMLVAENVIAFLKGDDPLNQVKRNLHQDSSS